MLSVGLNMYHERGLHCQNGSQCEKKKKNYSYHYTRVGMPVEQF